MQVIFKQAGKNQVTLYCDGVSIDTTKQTILLVNFCGVNKELPLKDYTEIKIADHVC